MSHGLVARNVHRVASPRAAGPQQRQPPGKSAKEPTGQPGRQPSGKLVARDQRNDSAWLTPVFPPRASVEEPPQRDAFSDDIFYKAYYDPSFQQVLSDFTDDLKKEHRRDSPTQDENTPNGAIWSTRDGKTPETCFDIMVMGQSRVGKSTFIARTLGIEPSEVNPPVPRPIEFHGQTYYFKIRERSLSDIDVQKPETLERAYKKWEANQRKHGDANPARTDGFIGLYDITDRRSLDPLPISVRMVQRTGKPCLLAATKADCSISRRELDPDGVEKKVRLVVGKLLSTKPTSHPDGPYRSLGVLLSEIAKLYQLPSPPVSRPRSKSSLLKLQVATKSGHSRPSSKHQASKSTSSTSGAPLPHYVAVAVNAASQSPPPEPQTSPGSEPFSPLSPRTLDDVDANDGSDQASIGLLEEFNADNLKALPSHVLGLNTFEELVARACFRDDPALDRRFDFNFLTFYRFFATPLKLLNALIGIYDTADAEHHATQSELPSRSLQFLSQWITTHPGDFADEDIYTRLEDFLEKFSQRSPYFPVAEQIRMASGRVDKDDDGIWSLPLATEAFFDEADEEREDTVLLCPSKSANDAMLDAQLIFKAHSTLSEQHTDRTRAHTISVDQTTIPYNMTTTAQRLSALLDPSSRLPFTKMQWRELMAQPEIAIARELTRIDWIIFSAIQPRDFVRHITIPIPERHRYKELLNVTRWIDHFNHVAYWTTNLIILRDKPKHRALALTKLILVGRKLREMNNYNSLGAVIAGIQATAVHRLAATRELVPVDVQKNLMKLEVLMSTQKGHSTYRLAWENSSGSRIPFLPLHRRDLVVAEQGNKTWITVADDEHRGERHINWNKFSILGAMLWDLYEAQSMPYPGTAPNESIRTLLLDGVIVKDDDRLYERSQAVEPSAAGSSNARRKFAPWLARYGM